MAISLYDFCVPTYLQILGATEGVLSCALSHFNDNNIDRRDAPVRRHGAGHFDRQYPCEHARLHQKGKSCCDPRLFEKTDTRRQAELVRLAALLAVPVAG